jgi:hypothetical protein
VTAHKFVVGQKVAFRPEDGQLVNRREVFIVVRQLPETGGMFQYQIKSEIDGHVRVVREIQLADLGSWCDQNDSNNNRPDAFAASGGVSAALSPSRRC